MYARIKFYTYNDFIGEQSATVSRKENSKTIKIIRVIQLILETKTPNFPGNRPGVA
jgi:hypothetical protein